VQVLTVDIGTGTQDIYLFRAGLGLENGFKLVMPSPTMIVRDQLLAAAERGEDVLLTGVTMGGGPSQWAAEAHRRSGRRLFATPDAARSFNDDLDWLARELGITIVAEDEAARLVNVTRIPLRDFDYSAVRSAFEAFGVDLQPQTVAVAVFDHGAAPPDVSDRQFRFDYLEARIRAENSLTAFAFLAGDIPAAMTRMQAVAQSCPALDCPLLVMDTAPAAVLGATYDPLVAARERSLIANIGNFHTLAFRLGPTGIEGLFEHHTGLLDLPRLERLLQDLAAGTLTHASVFGDHGHGALVLEPSPLLLDDGVVVTGPRRSMMVRSRLRPYFAVPYGDMMIAGCIGLLVAVADRLPALRGPIEAALEGAGAHTPPWEIEG